MRTFLLRLLSFMAFAAVTYVLLVCTWGGLMPQKFKKNLNYKIGLGGHLFTRLQEVQDFGPVDILFLGSSHAYRGFDTRIFEAHGIRAFNLGSSGQSPIQSRLLLERFLDELQPRMVVFEVFPRTFCSDGVESSLDIIANQRNDLLSVRMACSQRNVKVWNTLLYGLWQDLRGRHDGFTEDAVVGKDTYRSGGFVERQPNPKGFVAKPFYAPSRWKVNEMQFEEFTRIASLLQTRGIQLVTVQAPTSDGFRRDVENSDEFDERISAYGPYFNFNERMDLGDSRYYYDSHHLTQVGVELFNEALLPALKEFL